MARFNWRNSNSLLDRLAHSREAQKMVDTRLYPILGMAKRQRHTKPHGHQVIADLK